MGYQLDPELVPVPVEFHLHPGAPHGWSAFAPHAGSARRALTDRARVISAPSLVPRQVTFAPTACPGNRRATASGISGDWFRDASLAALLADSEAG